MKKINFAVVGCGNVAVKSMIPALIKSEYSEVSVCVDTDCSKEKIIKSKFNLPFVTSLSEAIKLYDFDVVYISTPIGTHKELIFESVNYNKNIICEKSLASNIEETKEIINVCKEKNIAIFEGFMYQFHHQHKLVKELINNGEIGEPFHFQAWFGFPPLPENNFRYNKSLGGGALLDAGAYVVHSARKFFNSEPVNVFSSLDFMNKDVEIRGTALLEFENKKTASLVFGFDNMYQNKYCIWGNKGVLTLERAFSVPADFQSKIHLITQNKDNIIKTKPCNHFLKEIEYFINNYRINKVKEFWRTEIINQSKVMNLISVFS